MDGQKRERLDGFALASLIGFLAAPGEVGEMARGNADKAATWSYDQAEAMERVRDQRLKEAKDLGK